MKVGTKWRLAKWKGVQQVYMICPGCGEEYRLDHDISAEGVVSPSLECPSQNDCGFHDTVVLLGWNAGPVSRVADNG